MRDKSPRYPDSNLGTGAGIKAVIFDLGNVLVNYDGKATLTALSELAGASLETVVAYTQTVEFPFGTGQLDGRRYYALLAKNFGLSANYESFVAAICRYQQRNEAGLAFARELHALPDVVVGIISNTNEVHAGWLHANLPELRLFRSVILSNEAGLLKPDPAIYELSLQQLGVAPDHALFVDDVAENVAGGTAVGLTGYLHQDWAATRPFIKNWLQKG